MLEKLIFSLLACSLFIVIFFKIIRKNDANYMILLVLQAIGITVNFVEIHLKIEENVFWGTIRYIFSLRYPKIEAIELFSNSTLSPLRAYPLPSKIPLNF